MRRRLHALRVGAQNEFRAHAGLPFAVHFAEAVGAAIFALPYSQFCIHKTARQQFSIIDLTGHYDDLGLRNQFAPEKLLKLIAAERFPRLMRVARKLLLR
jgi:hypothetical protein